MSRRKNYVRLDGPPKSSPNNLTPFIAVGAVLLLATIAMTITFGVLWGNARAANAVPAGPVFYPDEKGCQFSDPILLEIRELETLFIAHAFGFGSDAASVVFGNGWVDFRPNNFMLPEAHFYTTEQNAIDNSPAFRYALELKAKIEEAVANPNIGGLEKLNINFIVPELDRFLTHTRINWDVESNGSCLLDWGWNCHILEHMVIFNFFIPGEGSQPDFGEKVNLWLEQFVPRMQEWVAHIQATVDSPNPHTHSHDAVVTWPVDWEFFNAPGVISSTTCAQIPDASEKATCESLATQADTAIADYMAIWNGPYAAAALANRPQSSPGLSSAHQGAEAYDAWIKYHTELVRSPADIRAEGVSNVAGTQLSIGAAMARLDPPETYQDFVNRVDDCSDPLMYVQGGNISCVEDTFEEYECHKPALDFFWSVIGDISIDVHSINGYLSRNAFKQSTDGTGSTYIQGAGYDQDRALMTRSARINWGGFDCPATGKKSFDRHGATTTQIHEFLPGHGAQITLESEIVCKVTNATASTAWFEGYGLWTENLGFLMRVSDDRPLGLYQDPIQEAGRWSANLLRTSRLVVDTDLHAFQKSYQDCVDFYGNVGLGVPFGESECRRYTIMPGQALAYWLGKNQFEALDTKLKAELGADYDIKEFILLTTKFGGFFVFSDANTFLDTYILWKKGDPAAIGGFGYDLLVENLYLQAAPTVAKGGFNLSAVTAIDPNPTPLSKKKTTSKRSFGLTKSTSEILKEREKAYDKFYAGKAMPHTAHEMMQSFHPPPRFMKLR
jgi:hypothetical protein